MQLKPMCVQYKCLQIGIGIYMKSFVEFCRLRNADFSDVLCGIGKKNDADTKNWSFLFENEQTYGLCYIIQMCYSCSVLFLSIEVFCQFIHVL